jgi:hypothetical protein
MEQQEATKGGANVVRALYEVLFAIQQTGFFNLLYYAQSMLHAIYLFGMVYSKLLPWDQVRTAHRPTRSHRVDRRCSFSFDGPGPVARHQVVLTTQELITPVDAVLQALSAPAYMLNVPGAFITTAFSVLFMLGLGAITVATGYATVHTTNPDALHGWRKQRRYALQSSSLGAVWLLTVLRAFLGIADMFYIVPLRIFLAWVSESASSATGQ